MQPAMPCPWASIETRIPPVIITPINTPTIHDNSYDAALTHSLTSSIIIL